MIWREVIEGPRMRFLVLSRAEAQKVAPQEPYLVISITDREARPAVLADSPHRVAILRLRFDDTETFEGDRFPMLPEYARQIIQFVRDYLDTVRLIVCHCEQGISRSAAVAAALSNWIQQEDTLFFQYYLPNRHVYQTILEIAHRSDLHSSVNSKNAQIIQAFKKIGA